MMYQHDIVSRKALSDFDQSLIWPAIFLLGLGLVMVYSASISIAGAGSGTHGYPAYFLLRHAAYLAVGLLAGVIAFQIPLRWWQKYSFPLFLIGVVLLALWAVVGPGAPLWSLALSVVVMFVVAMGLTGLGLCLAWPMDSTAGFHAIMMIFHAKNSSAETSSVIPSEMKLRRMRSR